MHVKELPQVALSGDKSVCYNATATVTATGAGTYAWKKDGTSITPTNNAQFKEKLTNTTDLTVVGTKDGCQSNPVLYNVSVKPKVTPNWGSQPSVCEGGDITITVNGVTSIDWGNNITTGATRTLANIQKTNVDTAEYNITAWYDGCSHDTTIKITVNNAPAITFDATNAGSPVQGKTNHTQICLNDNVKLIANANNSDITWNTGAAGNTLNEKPSTPGSVVYKATAIDATTGCKASETFTVDVKDRPIIKINNELNGKEAVCEGATFNLVASGLPQNSTYTWKKSVNGGTTYTQTTVNNPITAVQNTIFRAIGTNTDQCVDSTDYTLTVNSNPVFNFSYTAKCSAGVVLPLPTPAISS